MWKMSSAVLRELRITWLLMKDNYPVVFTGPTLMVASLIARGAFEGGWSLWDTVQILLRVWCWCFLFLYTFEYHNQMGHERCAVEDRVCKPHRPYASGLITKRGGQVRPSRRSGTACFSAFYNLFDYLYCSRL